MARRAAAKRVALKAPDAATRAAATVGVALKEGVWVSYYYGFSADLGGGEYDRPIMQPPAAKIYQVREQETFAHIGDALTQWGGDQPAHAVIEITDSGLYVEREPINISLQEKQSLQIRAANRKRPVIHLSGYLTLTRSPSRANLPDNRPFTLGPVLSYG